MNETFEILIDKTYRHYKGEIFKVTGFVWNLDRNEGNVLLRRLKGQTEFPFKEHTTSIKTFIGTVKIEGKGVKRYELYDEGIKTNENKKVNARAS